MKGINKIILKYENEYFLWNINNLRINNFEKLDISFIINYIRNNINNEDNIIYDKFKYRNQINKLHKKKFDLINSKYLYKIFKKYYIINVSGILLYLLRHLKEIIPYIYNKESQNEYMITKLKNSIQVFLEILKNDIGKIEKYSDYITCKKYYESIWNIALKELNLKYEDIRPIPFKEIVNINPMYIIYKYLYSKEAKEFLRKYPLG